MKKYVKPETKLVDYTTDSIMLDYDDPKCADVTEALSSSGLPTGKTVTFTATVNGKAKHARITLPAGQQYRIKTYNAGTNRWPNMKEVANWHTCTQKSWEGYGECEADIVSDSYADNFIEVYSETQKKWITFTGYTWVYQ